MSVGPMGMVRSAAGSPLAQTKGSDLERAQQDAADHTRRTAAAERAENAAGVGQTEEDQEAADRDADGRRLWEPRADEPEAIEGIENLEQSVRSKDPTGDRGANLDLSG